MPVPRKQQVIGDLEATQETLQAAREHELGQLRQVVAAVSDEGIRARPKDNGVRMCEFEHGMVFQAPGRAPLAFRWDKIHAVYQKSVASYINGSYMGTAFTYVFVRQGGGKLTLSGRVVDPQRGRFTWSQPRTSDIAEAATWAKRYADFCAAAARQATVAQLPAARDALANGKTVRFGEIVISAQGIRAPKMDFVPWPLIRSVGTAQGFVEIVGEEKKGRALYHQHVEKTPNVDLLVNLARMLREQASS